MIQLAVKPRGSASAGEVRDAGAVPAVFYGPKEPSQSIVISAVDVERVWHEAGETTMVRLTGLGEEKDVLFRDVQLHPVTDTILHVDFYVPEKGKKVEISVPLVFSGVSPAEKAGHVLVKALHEIEIAVLPVELPHELVVDISILEKIGDHVTAGQIKLPPSAELKIDAHDIVASITGVEEEVVIPVAPTAEATTEAPAADAEQK